jgi:GT2 family glycosyltransferase
MAQPTVTIIVVPREQFGKTQASLESIFEHTRLPFSLIYVDGKSPPRVRRYLEKEAKRKNFHLIRSEHYIPANQARNLAMRQVETKYVVFLDNDVVVSPNWLEPLIDCVEETGAWIVGPLYCMDDPKDQIIHTAGADYRIVESDGKRRVHEWHFLCGRRVPEVRAELKRRPIDLVEFHCLLAQTDVLKQWQLIDDNLLSWLDHIDTCLLARQNGGAVFIEPRSIVTYLRPPPVPLSDLPFFLLRWSDRWLSASVNHFTRKHRLDRDDPHFRAHAEYLTEMRRRVVHVPRRIFGRLVAEPRLQKIDLAIGRICDRIVVPRVADIPRSQPDRTAERLANG